MGSSFKETTCSLLEIPCLKCLNAFQSAGQREEGRGIQRSEKLSIKENITYVLVRKREHGQNMK